MPLFCLHSESIFSLDIELWVDSFFSVTSNMVTSCSGLCRLWCEVLVSSNAVPLRVPCCFSAAADWICRQPWLCVCLSVAICSPLLLFVAHLESVNLSFITFGKLSAVILFSKIFGLLLCFQDSNYTCGTPPDCIPQGLWEGVCPFPFPKHFPLLFTPGNTHSPTEAALRRFSVLYGDFWF